MSFEFLRNKRTKIIFLSLFWGVLSLLLLLWLCCPAWLQRHFSPIAACSSDNSEQAVDSIGLHSRQVDRLLRAPRNIETLVAGRTRYRSPTADSAPRVIHPFEKPAQRWSAGHRGVDLAVPDRDRHVYAPAPGRVVFSGTVVNRKVLVIAHPDGRRSTFEPMDEALPVGTEVTAGDAVGTVAAPESAGENGERPYRRCSVPCLYWGVRQGGARGDGSGREAEYVNPMSLLGSQDPSILLPVPGGY